MTMVVGSPQQGLERSCRSFQRTGALAAHSWMQIEGPLAPLERRGPEADRSTMCVDPPRRRFATAQNLK